MGTPGGHRTKAWRRSRRSSSAVRKRVRQPVKLNKNDDHNFLAGWGKWPWSPAHLLNTLVIHVSVQEAKDYCKFYHERLPQTYEFQSAAQGLSCYHAQTAVGTDWYFENFQELHTHNKYYLMDDSYERAATVGFRCVAD